MAERMGASLSTVRRMEKGDGRVPLHFYASALHVLGEGVSAVVISEVRQRRVPNTKPVVTAAANTDIADAPAAAC